MKRIVGALLIAGPFVFVISAFAAEHGILQMLVGLMFVGVIMAAFIGGFYLLDA